MVRIGHLLTNGLEVIGEHLYFLACQRYDGIVHREQQQRRHVLHILDEPVVVLGGEHDAETLEVGRRLIVVDDMSLGDEHQVARLNHLLACVDTILRLALLAHRHQNEVKTRGRLRDRCFADAVGEYQTVSHVLGIAPLLCLFQCGICNSIVYHVFTGIVCPAFRWSVLLWLLYNKVTVPAMRALIWALRTLPPFHSKLTS